jgi:hypothetical protein
MNPRGRRRRYRTARRRRNAGIALLAAATLALVGAAVYVSTTSADQVDRIAQAKRQGTRPAPPSTTTSVPPTAVPQPAGTASTIEAIALVQTAKASGQGRAATNGAATPVMDHGVCTCNCAPSQTGQQPPSTTTTTPQHTGITLPDVVHGGAASGLPVLGR